MSGPLEHHKGNTFEPTRRWHSATVLLETLLSLAVLLLMVGFAFACWRIFADKPNAFAPKAAISQPASVLVMSAQ